jgi:hypothetical protein
MIRDINKRAFRGSANRAASVEDETRVKDMQRVISCTNELVELALKADWSGVLDGMDGRRQLLQQIMDGDRLDPDVLALSEAVEESERALMRVVAHAIASSRLHGAQFAMYH